MLNFNKLSKYVIMQNINKENNYIKVLSVEKNNPIIDIINGNGKATAIVWPEVGAKERSFYLIEIDSKSFTKQLKHPSEAVYYIKNGSGKVFDKKENTVSEIIQGSMVHVSAFTTYYFEAGEKGLIIIGGPCPYDPGLI